jgi:hypothetical protein
MLEDFAKLIAWVIPVIVLAAIFLPQTIRILREYDYVKALFGAHEPDQGLGIDSESISGGEQLGSLQRISCAMPWLGVLPPSEHYSLDYVHYSLLGNPVRVRIPGDCLQLGNHEHSTGISLIWHKRLAFIYPLLNRGVTAVVGGGDNAWISRPKHP